VLYNLARRGIEFDLLPWCIGRGVDVMAYSPLDEGRLVGHSALERIASACGATPAQLALAWLLRDGRVAVIPKASRLEHVRSNHASRDLLLDEKTLAALDAAFPPPGSKRPLDVI
jgi:diketogulonate reductase-like aldo/keto reductase